MMFELLALDKKNLLEFASRCSLQEEINSKISIANSLLSTNRVDVDSILTDYQRLHEANNSVLIKVKNLIADIDQTMTEKGLRLLDNPIYVNRFNSNSVTNKLIYNNELDVIIKSTIFKYVSWQYPVLYLDHAILPNLIDYLVASDPLYIVSLNNDALSKINKYPTLYQQRLRLYSITGNVEDLSVLPHNQFGFIFNWGFFNSLTTIDIENYLRKMLHLLRPGGTMLFSYNNAELPATASIIDRNALPWASKKYIETILLQLGYKIIKFDDLYVNENNTFVSWAEVLKPGELSTIKKRQVIGSIRQK